MCSLFFLLHCSLAHRDKFCQRWHRPTSCRFFEMPKTKLLFHLFFTFVICKKNIYFIYEKTVRRAPQLIIRYFAGLIFWRRNFHQMRVPKILIFICASCVTQKRRISIFKICTLHDLVFYAKEAIRFFAQYPCFDTSLPSVSIFHKKLFVSHFKKAQKDCNVVQTQFFFEK